jgi:hypothetical protein
VLTALLTLLLSAGPPQPKLTVERVYDLATLSEVEAQRIAGEAALFRVSLANDA